MDPEKIGSLLECSVCLEPLGSNHKVLPCQHTFCLPCLEDVWAGHHRRAKAKAAAAAAAAASSSSSSDPAAAAATAAAAASSEAGLPLCPECRTECSVKEPKFLPTNVILNRLLEGMQQGISSVGSPTKKMNGNNANHVNVNADNNNGPELERSAENSTSKFNRFNHF